jgi:hypothetical protein
MEHINKISGQSSDVLVITTSCLYSIIRRVIAQSDFSVSVLKDARLTPLEKTIFYTDNLKMFRHTHVNFLVPYSTHIFISMTRLTVKRPVVTTCTTDINKVKVKQSRYRPNGPRGWIEV